MNAGLRNLLPVYNRITSFSPNLIFRNFLHKYQIHTVPVGKVSHVQVQQSGWRRDARKCIWALWLSNVSS